MGVVVIDEVREKAFELVPVEYQLRSRHSRRIVPTNRSAMGFARGARTGVRMMLTPSDAKISSKLAMNLASRSRIKNLTATSRSARTEDRLPRGCRAGMVTNSQKWLGTLPPTEDLSPLAESSNGPQSINRRE